MSSRFDRHMRWDRNMFNPLGLSPAVVVMLVMGMMVVQLASYIVWALAAMAHPLYRQVFNPVWEVRALWVFALVIVAGLGLCWVALRQHQQQRWDMRISYVATFLYSAVMLFGGYSIGTMTLTFGFALAGVPFLCLFLLPGPAVLGMAVGALVSWLALTILAVEGLIPYAPAYALPRPELMGAIQRFDVWSQLFYALPLVLVTAFGGYRVRKRWQHVLQRFDHQLRQVPGTDALNRLALLERLAMACEPRPVPLSVLLIQLVRLPELQRHCGFVAVETLLQQCTAQLVTQLRGDADLGCLGDGEWVLLLEDTAAAVAEGVAGRCRQALMALDAQQVEGGRVALRFGMALLTVEGQERGQVTVQQALDALRQARATSKGPWCARAQVAPERFVYSRPDAAT